MPVNGPNPRKANRFGQIVRWQPAAGDHAADTFKWELFLLAGNPSFYSATDAKSGSENITPENMFNAPDGLHFDDNGLLWIQTDGWYQNNREFEGHGNNQMQPASGYCHDLQTLGYFGTTHLFVSTTSRYRQNADRQVH